MPLTLPSYAFIQTDFNLMITDAYNTLAGGQGFGTEIAPPFWDVSISGRNMKNAEQGYWDAFFKACRGTKQSFLMYDVNRPTPIMHPNPLGMARAIGGAFPGYAGITAIADVNTLDVKNLPAAFTMTPGDYVSVVEDDRYSLHMITALAIGDGSGNAVWNIEPYLNIDLFDTDAQVWVYHPQGEFILKNGTQPTRTRGLTAMPISFEAISRIQ